MARKQRRGRKNSDKGFQPQPKPKKVYTSSGLVIPHYKSCSEVTFPKFINHLRAQNLDRSPPRQQEAVEALECVFTVVISAKDRRRAKKTRNGRTEEGDTARLDMEYLRRGLAEHFGRERGAGEGGTGAAAAAAEASTAKEPSEDRPKGKKKKR
ncbi:uncharacterized protein LTR77_005649 [Saxophila tyrrhenica]|uniref:Uncharacterized protein n=1 Tax=Saxophila tyrrhenica TaxID=1690608 RepID=A0AAV9PBB3_9PEZI|nr:hypothetical protein LTR77_005649 [Saxophila tyrrhenica]